MLLLQPQNLQKTTTHHHYPTSEWTTSGHNVKDPSAASRLSPYLVLLVVVSLISQPAAMVMARRQPPTKHA
jgi:hypothetical protein